MIATFLAGLCIPFLLHSKKNPVSIPDGYFGMHDHWPLMHSTMGPGVCKVKTLVGNMHHNLQGFGGSLYWDVVISYF